MIRNHTVARSIPTPQYANDRTSSSRSGSGGGSTAAIPPRTYRRIRNTSTTASAPYTNVAAISYIPTSPADSPDTARAVNIHTPSTPDGFGATTNGWRPISVKIQPKLFARNGVTM